MPYNAITRLRLRSPFTLPAFMREVAAITAQAAQAPGFLSGALLAEGWLVFWTRTVWESEAAMQAFRDCGAHRAAMPKLAAWCDEASVAHWGGEAASDWGAIYLRMAGEGRPSRVHRPSRAHRAGRLARMARWAPEQKIG